MVPNQPKTRTLSKEAYVLPDSWERLSFCPGPRPCGGATAPHVIANFPSEADPRMLTREESSNPSASVGSADSLPGEHSRLERRLFFALGAIALIYAFLAALATVADPDLGWHLATGRWVAQHHHVFTGDPFSYTVPGTPAIYPPFGGFILYGLYLLGGFKLLSWVSALACAGTIALLLRRGNAVTAAIAILAIPFIAYRSVPRAEIFAIV